MSASRRKGSDSGLVPIAERLHWMRIFRLGVLVLTWVGWHTAPDDRGTGPVLLGALSLLYLALSMSPLQVWVKRRDIALRIFGVSLLGDGLFLGLSAYSPHNAVTPLRFLVPLHLIAVALLASFRTALKLTVWHTLLFTAELQAREVGLLPKIHADQVEIVAYLLLIWLVALTTSSFAAVNERELRRRGIDLASLADLGARLQRDHHAPAIADAILAELSGTLQVGRALLVHVQDETWALLAATGEHHSAGDRVAGNDQLIRRAAHDRTVLLVDGSDPRQDPWLHAVWPGAHNIGLAVLHADGAAHGVLIFENGMRRGSRIEHRAVTMIEQIASQASLALANAHLVDRLHRAATMDGLTGAANRRTFDQRLAAEIELTANQGPALTLVMVDVDHFKSVNDNHGHAVGDDVLRHVVAILQAASRGTDLVARYGGEEFAVIMPNTTQDEAWQVAERYRLNLAGATDSPVPVTASFGVATMPDHGMTAVELSKVADDALYRAKREGRNRVVGGRPMHEVSAGH